MKLLRACLVLTLVFSAIIAKSQDNWVFRIGLGSSLYAGNINDLDVNHYASVTRNDSVVALDFHYKLLYSALIHKDDAERKWEKSNFEINGGVKMDLYQYGRFSPFLACEMLTNKFKGYDLKVSGLAGVKYRIYTVPKVCDYSISAAFVYDWNNFTDETKLRNNNYRISIRPKFRQKIGTNLSLYHCTFYQPSVLDWGDYIVDSETKLETQLTKVLFLDLTFDYEYHSRVPNEELYQHYDLLTAVSLKLVF